MPGRVIVDAAKQLDVPISRVYAQLSRFSVQRQEISRKLQRSLLV